MVIKVKTKYNVGDKAWAIVDGEMANEVCECCGGIMLKDKFVAEVDIGAIFVVSRKKDETKTTYQVYKRVYSVLDEEDLFLTKEEAEKELKSRGEIDED